MIKVLPLFSCQAPALQALRGPEGAAGVRGVRGAVGPAAHLEWSPDRPTLPGREGRLRYHDHH